MAKPSTHWLPRWMDKVTIGDDCWEWQGNLSPQGYGRLWHDGEKRQTHRLMYELFKGPVPDGLMVDHLCRNRKCCRPDHLEAVTNRENMRRGLRGVLLNACPQGHEYTPENTAYRPPHTGRDNRGPSRYCKECNRIRARANHARRRAA